MPHLIFALVRVNQEITAATEAQALECSSSRRCLDRRQLNAGKVNLGQTPDDTGRERRLQPFLGQSLGGRFAVPHYCNRAADVAGIIAAQGCVAVSQEGPVDRVFYGHIRESDFAGQERHPCNYAY